MRRSARSVVDVIAGEAGYSLSAMKDVASAIYNRAKELGVSPEDVVSVKSEFNAYGGPMPSSAKRAMAAKAFAAVMQDGPTHKGTFYARSYATHNLPKGLTRVKTAVDDHVYFSDPKNRAIKTAVGFKTPNPHAVTAPQSNLPRTVNALPSARPSSIASSLPARPESIAPNSIGALGKPQMAGRKPGFIGGVTANTQGKPSLGRMLDPQSAGLGMMPSSPNLAQRISDNVAPAPNAGVSLRDVMAAQNTFSRIHPSTQQDAIAHLMDVPSNVTPGQTDPAMARELDRQMMAGLPQGQTETQMPPDPAEENAAAAAFAAVPSYSQPAAFTAFDRPSPVDPSYAAPTSLSAVSGLPKIGTPDEPYPAPPLSPPVDVAMRKVAPISRRQTPRREALQITVNRPRDPLADRTLGGVRPTERFHVNSINDAMNGPRGATAFSRSMPGVAMISRGPNIGTALHNTITGATTLYSPSGNITGVRFDKPGGFFGALGGSSASGGGSNSLGGASGGFGSGGGGSTRTGNSR